MARNKTALLVGLTVALASPAATRTAISPAAPSLPQVEGPIPVSASSRPWAQASSAVEPVDLAKAGFVEEEFFVRGIARTLDWPAVGKLDELARGPYVTRILVRRPSLIGIQRDMRSGLTAFSMSSMIGEGERR